MTIKFARRAASEMLGRGESSIRVNPASLDDVKKAMTREDVRRLIQSGGILALKEKRNISMNSKILKERRSKGRRRGQGKRRGTDRARQGSRWAKKARSQRRLLKKLRSSGKIEGSRFKKYYRLVKGGAFADKASLMLHMNEDGVKVSAEELKAISEEISKEYKR
jgi:large subunit ribosomal protein L19e